jgi:peptidoglycan hydrolase-like protein with peptidoglycan-binding domain
MAAWLAEYCAARPKAPFVEAVGALVNRLCADRMRALAEPADLPESAAGISVYAPTLRRVQDRLIAPGHLSGPATGSFDDATGDALQAYQAANGLQPTGLPDQPTLASLPQPACPGAAGRAGSRSAPCQPQVAQVTRS